MLIETFLHRKAFKTDYLKRFRHIRLLVTIISHQPYGTEKIGDVKSELSAQRTQ